MFFVTPHYKIFKCLHHIHSLEGIVFNCVFLDVYVSFGVFIGLLLYKLVQKHIMPREVFQVYVLT